MDNIIASSRQSMHSAILGDGYELRTVPIFCFFYSTQKRSVPPFFGAGATGDVHFYCAVPMTFVANILSILEFSKSLHFGLRW